MALAVISPPLALLIQCPARPNEGKQIVVGIHKAIVAANEGNVDAFADVFFVEAEAPLQLHLKKGLAVDVAGDEVRALPIIGQAQAIEAIVCHPRRNLVEVEIFLLARIELTVGHPSKRFLLAHAAAFLVVILV